MSPATALQDRVLHFESFQKFSNEFQVTAQKLHQSKKLNSLKLFGQQINYKQESKQSLKSSNSSGQQISSGSSDQEQPKTPQLTGGGDVPKHKLAVNSGQPQQQIAPFDTSILTEQTILLKQIVQLLQSIVKNQNNQPTQANNNIEIDDVQQQLEQQNQPVQQQPTSNAQPSNPAQKNGLKLTEPFNQEAFIPRAPRPHYNMLPGIQQYVNQPLFLPSPSPHLNQQSPCLPPPLLYKQPQLINNLPSQQFNNVHPQPLNDLPLQPTKTPYALPPPHILNNRNNQRPAPNNLVQPPPPFNNPHPHAQQVNYQPRYDNNLQNLEAVFNPNLQQQNNYEQLMNVHQRAELAKKEPNPFIRQQLLNQIYGAEQHIKEHEHRNRMQYDRNRARRQQLIQKQHAMIHVPQHQGRPEEDIYNLPPQQQIRAPVYQKQSQQVNVESLLLPAVPGGVLNDTERLTRLFNNFGIKIVNNYKQYITLIDGSLLGQGVNGSVFAGKLRDRPNENVAVKTQDLSKEAIRDIYVLKKADHPNLMNLKDTLYDATEKKIILTMEIMPASLLMVWDAYVTKSGYAFAVPCILYILYELTKGLNYLHSNLGFFHGDIKPANILVSASGEIKLTDFGGSRLLNSKSTHAGGTYCYMAPECGNSNMAHDHTSDSWSLGILLIELLDNRRPLDGTEGLGQDDQDGFLRAIANRNQVPVPQRHVPAFLADILRGLLALDPTKRMTIPQLEKKLMDLINADKITLWNCNQFTEMLTHLYTNKK